jgi:hypothetical protein
VYSAVKPRLPPPPPPTLFSLVEDIRVPAGPLVLLTLLLFPQSRFDFGEQTGDTFDVRGDIFPTPMDPIMDDEEVEDPDRFLTEDRS